MNILREGRQYRFFNDLEIIKKLENKNYVFKFNVTTLSMWLEEADPFILPSKIYDTDSKLLEYVKIDFNNIDSNLGVLLEGEKGQGKSLTAKQICIKSELPTIILKDKIPSNIDFIGFLSNIKQDIVLFVDELEKLFSTYNEDDYHSQQSFLTFMDGVMSQGNKVLFLLTSNDNIDS